MSDNDTKDVAQPSPASRRSARQGVITRELFDTLTRRDRILMMETLGNVPRWVLTGGAIQRTAAAPVVFVKAYRSHRSRGMRVGEAAFCAWRWAQAFCL